MKQKFITLTLLILACLSARAYEVYEHNQGLVKKSKVMNARYAKIWDQCGEPSDNFCIWFHHGILQINDLDDQEINFIGVFPPKLGDFAIITPTSIRIESGSKERVDFILEINYNLVNGEKIYTIQFHDNNKNINATVNGRPIFFKDFFGSDTLIGSETTKGCTPVLLEWLEYQLKKNKFKIIYE